MFSPVTKFLLYMLSNSCPHGWHFFGGSCYIGYKEEMDFSHASQKCKDNQGYFVQINSLYENDFVHSIQKTINLTPYIDSPIWIGLSDEFPEGNFTRIESGDKVSYTNWAPGEPNNVVRLIDNFYPDGGEDCVEMNYYSWLWNDLQCTLVRVQFCECNCLE